MIQFVRVGEMFAIPCDEKIAFMQRGERKMHGIAKSPLGHQPMLEIKPHSFFNRLFRFQHRHVFHQRKR